MPDIRPLKRPRIESEQEIEPCSKCVINKKWTCGNCGGCDVVKHRNLCRKICNKDTSRTKPSDNMFVSTEYNNDVWGNKIKAREDAHEAETSPSTRLASISKALGIPTNQHIIEPLNETILVSHRVGRISRDGPHPRTVRFIKA